MVGDEGGGGDDVNNFGQSWGQVRHEVYHGIHHGQRYEVKAGRVSGHSQVEVGIDRGKLQARSCSHREVCVVEAGDNMEMARVAERAIVVQASVPRYLQAQLDATLRNK
jgi:hypothetical protein